MKELRLLICADLHASEDAIKLLGKVASEDTFDAVVVCGDLTTYGSEKYVKKVIDTLGPKLLAVPGNCDTADTLKLLEQSGCSLHGASFEIDGRVFYGCGGGLPSTASMPFELDEKEIVRLLNDVAVKGGVMVTHTPPHGMNDVDRSGRNAGSRGIMGVIEKHRPRMVLSGHIHESRGCKETDGTVFVNPGPASRGAHYAIARIGEDIQVDLF